MELTKEAKRALINTVGRRGARVWSQATADVMAELLGHGLVTRAGNLTDRGMVAHYRILDEMLEAM